MEHIDKVNWARLLRDEMVDKNAMPSFGNSGSDYFYGASYYYTIRKAGSPESPLKISWTETEEIKTSGKIYIDDGDLKVTSPGLYLIHLPSIYISDNSDFIVGCFVMDQLFDFIEHHSSFPVSDNHQITGVIPIWSPNSKIPIFLEATKDLSVDILSVYLLKLTDFIFSTGSEE